jgi:hypothetical protein
MYLWRRTLRRQEFGRHDVVVAPTVGCTARWGQIPAAVGHGVGILTSWPTTPGDLAPQGTGSATAIKEADPLLLAPPSLLQTFDFQPFRALLSEVCF